MAGRRLGTLVAVVALASGTLVPGAQAAPHPVVFGTASALPKTHTGACPATVTLSTTVKVKAPATLKYVWTFSDGDDGRTRTYRAGGKGLKTVRLSTTVKAVGDARGRGADLALVSKYGMRKGLKAGPITFSDLYQVQPDGFHPDVWSMTGAQLRKALGHVSPTEGRLTPSAALRYTVTGGVVTDLTLNGTPVSDTQVVKVAANYILRYGGQGFPAWEGAKSVYRGGPDDTGALASYIAAHSPLTAPKGDRVTVR